MWNNIVENFLISVHLEMMFLMNVFAPAGKSATDIHSTLNNLNHSTFIQEIRSDIAKATSIASDGGLSFKDPLKAVYHYRKHGEEFPKIIRKYGNSLDVYLGPVKNHVIDRSNLRHIVKLQVKV